MRRDWRRRRVHEAAELNITAFMNLMVILAPFLLITAVFSRMAVLELNLPGRSSASEETPPEFQLEVTVRADRIDVGDRDTGLLKRIPLSGEEYDLEALSAFLQDVKAKYPDKVDATILVEPQIAYDVLVQVMDAVRVKALDDQSLAQGELFSEISIGDAVAAPAMAGLAEEN